MKDRSNSKKSNGTTKMSFSRDYMLDDLEEIQFNANVCSTNRLPLMTNMKYKTIGSIKNRTVGKPANIMNLYASTKSGQEKGGSLKRPKQITDRVSPPSKRPKHITKSTPL